VKGGLHVEDYEGQRWDLALEILESGDTSIFLRENLMITRDTHGPDADGRIHIAVLTESLTRPHEDRAQAEVNDARTLIGEIAHADERFASLLQSYGVTWLFAGDDGTATFKLADIDAHGVLIWTTLEPPT
jgi:hypothetical protein